jgi:hypothetical protein
MQALMGAAPAAMKNVAKNQLTKYFNRIHAL